MKHSINILFALYFCLITTAQASNEEIKSFQQDSLQQILAAHNDKPLILVMWSVTCASCLSELKFLHQIHLQHPDLSLVMLSVDGPEYHQEMRKILRPQKLFAIEQWGFIEDNSPALRYTIDKRWYGELPRTYFFDKQHHKTGVSGVLDHQQYNQAIKKILSSE